MRRSPYRTRLRKDRASDFSSVQKTTELLKSERFLLSMSYWASITRTLIIRLVLLKMTSHTLGHSLSTSFWRFEKETLPI